MTSRLLALAVICLFALMALMFMLGFTLGEKEADRNRTPVTSVDETRTTPLSSGSTGAIRKPGDPDPAATGAPASVGGKQ